MTLGCVDVGCVAAGCMAVFVRCILNHDYSINSISTEIRN